MINICKELQDVVSSLRDDAANAAACLYRINKSKDAVSATRFALSLGNDLPKHISDVAEANHSIEADFEGVCEYKGEDLSYKLQWAKTDSIHVGSVWQALSEAKECAEGEWVKSLSSASKSPKGFMLSYQYEGEPVDLLFNTPPVKQLKGTWFTLTANRFKVIEGPVLVLPLTIDAMRIGDRVYFLTKKGLGMFSTPEGVASQAQGAVEAINASGSIGNVEKFAEYAHGGHNPRRLLRYDEEKFKKVTDRRGGKKIREKFGLQMEDGKIVSETKEDVERLIKVVCNRGMLDPFSDDAMEVSGAEKWK